MRRPWLALSALLAPVFAHAAPYEDTKGRFRLDLASGWALAPQPGDMNGMIFRHVARARGQDKLAILMVRVEPGGEEPAAFADRVERELSRQRGFARTREASAEVGGARAVVREYRALASQRPKIEKAMRAHFLAAQGRLYLLHFESTPKEFKRLEPEVTRMLQSFVPLAPAGGERAAPAPGAPAALTGRWVNDDGLLLVLGDDGSFALAEAQGRYEINDNTLVMIIPEQGRESFTFALDSAAGTLTLSSPNLDGPMTYRRWSQAEAPRGRPRSASPDEPLVGRWSTPSASGKLILDLKADKSFSMGTMQGQWSKSDDRLVLSKAGQEVITYRYRLAGGRLLLSAGDLEDEVAFGRAE